MFDSTNTDWESLPPFAGAWPAQRCIEYERLERMPLPELRGMTEADSAPIFAQLDPPRPHVLSPSSGLVEQQRLFAMLHRRLREPITDRTTRGYRK